MIERVEITNGPRPRTAVRKYCEGQGRTHQEMAEQCDVNRIVRRWREKGQSPHLQKGTPMYGDFSGASGLQDAIEQVEGAKKIFGELPALVREAAGNSPVQFLEMVADPEGLDILSEAGLQVDDPPELPFSKPDESGPEKVEAAAAAAAPTTSAAAHATPGEGS